MTTTVAQAFESLSNLIDAAKSIGINAPDRTIQGRVAMDKEIHQLALNGTDMSPETVITTANGIVRVCTALFNGFLNMVQPTVFTQIEWARRTVSQLEERSALARTRFSTELASLKNLADDLGEMSQERKNEVLNSEDFVMEGLETLALFNTEMKDLESAIGAFKRKGAEIRAKQEEKDRQEALAKQVSVHDILSQLGRPSQVAPKGGRPAAKREADRRIRNEMKGSAGGKKGNRQMANA